MTLGNVECRAVAADGAGGPAVLDHLVAGIRLTTLAERSNLSLAACSEQLTELERLGYLERRPDPSDGRAKLIYPTQRGLQLLARAGDEVAQIEHRWRQLCPPGAFDDACRTLDHLLTAMNDQHEPD